MHGQSVVIRIYLMLILLENLLPLSFYFEIPKHEQEVQIRFGQTETFFWLAVRLLNFCTLKFILIFL